jgi:hypothetical protein
MKNATTNSTGKRKGWLIAATIAAIVLAATSIAVAISASQLAKLDDGTKNFTGVKREAAQHALVHVRNEWNTATFSALPFWPKDVLQVIKVEPGPGYCGSHYLRKPSDIGYYDVTVRDVWLFGSKQDSTWRGCILESDL